MEGSFGMSVHTRSGNGGVEAPFEKPVVLPDQSDQDPARHAWADARFATDIMAEHGVFFALLMPPEVAQTERQEALRFSERFADQRLGADGSLPASQGHLDRRPFGKAHDPADDAGKWEVETIHSFFFAEELLVGLECDLGKPALEGRGARVAQQVEDGIPAVPRQHAGR